MHIESVYCYQTRRNRLIVDTPIILYKIVGPQINYFHFAKLIN